MKTAIVLSFSLVLAACSADITSLPMDPPAQRKAGGDLPVPTYNEGHLGGRAFRATTAILRKEAFYQGYYRLQLLTADSTSLCAPFHNRYFEVNVPKGSPESKVVFGNIENPAERGRYYDYADGKKLSLYFETGWFQLANFFEVSGGTITLNVTDASGSNYVFGTYPVHKCF